MNPDIWLGFWLCWTTRIKHTERVGVNGPSNCWYMQPFFVNLVKSGLTWNRWNIAICELFYFLRIYITNQSQNMSYQKQSESMFVNIPVSCCYCQKCVYWMKLSRKRHHQWTNKTKNSPPPLNFYIKFILIIKTLLLILENQHTLEEEKSIH